MWKDDKFQGKWGGSLPAASGAPCNLRFFSAKSFGVGEAVPGRSNGVGLWLHVLFNFTCRMQTLLNELKGHRKTLCYYTNSR